MDYFTYAYIWSAIKWHYVCWQYSKCVCTLYRNGKDRILLYNVHSGEMMITCVRKPIGLFYKVVVEIQFIELSDYKRRTYFVWCIVFIFHGMRRARLEHKQIWVASNAKITVHSFKFDHYKGWTWFLSLGFNQIWFGCIQIEMSTY